jgi:dephospho-CoA kinase
VFRGRPIIGILGGIGSGKSFVARLFGELGCQVVNSDDLTTRVYEDKRVRRATMNWWGEGVFDEAGQINRRAVADRVFNDAEERRRLEGLIHPQVSRLRDREMKLAGKHVRAFVWDAPLLAETGLDRECDALVFVDVPGGLRLSRVRESRHWTKAEWLRREKMQLPLDKKRKMAKYIVRNTAGADEVRNQVRLVLSRIVAE